MLNLRDFGAVGDGVTDDTEAIRAWSQQLAGNHGYVEPGRYRYSDWTIPSECRIDGAGAAASIFHASGLAGVRNARPRWTTAVDQENGGPPWDSDITISNVSFLGESDAPLPYGSTPIAFIGVSRLKLRDVKISGFRSDLVVLHNVKRWHFDAVEMTDWGRLTHDAPGSGTYVGGCAVFVWHGCTQGRISHCDIHDGAGGLWLQDMEETILTGTRIANTREFDVVGVGRRSAYVGNILGRVTRVDVSGHNAELHGEEFIYGLNVHSDADGSNVYASNLHNVILPANLYLRPGEGQACLTLASHGAWAGVGDPPECVLIDGGLQCDQNKLAAHAILVTDQGGGPMREVVVSNNNTGDRKQWREGPTHFERKGVTAVHN